MTDTQVEQLRRDTPGCHQYIHFNNAGSSLPPLQVLKAQTEYLEQEAIRGGYELARERAADIEQFYEVHAQLINAHSDEMAFLTNATDAYNRALSAIPFETGDLILTTTNDYVSNQLAFLSLEKRYGIQLLRCPDLAQGGFDLAAMQDMIQRLKPRLVAVTHIPTNSGLIQDVAAVGKICREHSIWYLVDACQSAGHLELDVEQIGCDFLSATHRKFLRGPRGSGFLYVAKRVLDEGLMPLMPDLRGAVWTQPNAYEPVPNARRFEYWERSYASLVGAKAAVDYALELGMAQIALRIADLASYTRGQLNQLTAIRQLDQGQKLGGIITFTVDGRQPDDLMERLGQHKINAAVAPGSSAIIDFERKKAKWTMRIAPHCYNTHAEIDLFAEVLNDWINKGR